MATENHKMNGGIAHDAREKIQVPPTQSPSSSEPLNQSYSIFKRLVLPLRLTLKKPTDSSIKAPEISGDMNSRVQKKIDSDVAQNHHASTNHDMEASSSNNIQISRWDDEYVNELNVHGFDVELMVLQKMLGKRENNNGFKAIGIVGVRGVGKSTICQALLKNPEVKREFLPRIWVSMSREFVEDQDPRIAFVKRILACLGVENKIIEAKCPSDQTLGGLLYGLHLQLRGKRYLIVLDDVKEMETEDGWYSDLDSCLPDHKEMANKLAYGLPKGHGGSVIVTSRSEKAAKAMVGEQNLHHLLPLSDPESFWEIFRQEVERYGNSYNPSHLEELKEELLRKCGGLPLAAKMMGQIKLKES